MEKLKVLDCFEKRNDMVLHTEYGVIPDVTIPPFTGDNTSTEYEAYYDISRADHHTRRIYPVWELETYPLGGHVYNEFKLKYSCYEMPVQGSWASFATYSLNDSWTEVIGINVNDRHELHIGGNLVSEVLFNSEYVMQQSNEAKIFIKICFQSKTAILYANSAVVHIVKLNINPIDKIVKAHHGLYASKDFKIATTLNTTPIFGLIK